MNSYLTSDWIKIELATTLRSDLSTKIDLKAIKVVR